LLSSYRNSDEVTQKQEKLRTMKILRDEDWVYYKTLFSEVYSSFYNKMMSIPDLSEGDRRQVLLLKMGYTHKMSADVLGISTEGIKRARQRLARKLNLLDASKLEEYIQKL
jgi:DNA-binding CsgD family transcriptional regulator